MAALLFAATLAPSSSFSQGLPSGGEVVGGAAGISAANGRLDVNQTSPTAIISWEDFSVGEGAHAHFHNGNGATLNRVRGNIASRIDGRLTATGSLYLVNPNGVAVGQNGTVETGGSFVATTLDLSDDEFARAARGESYTLTGTSNARIVNAGKIGALGGDVVLAAREVENGGDIEASAGAVGLLAGNEVLIRDRESFDGRFLVKSRSADTSVKNTGNIKAVEVELRANGGNVYALAGNRGGIVTATGSATRNGRIFLTADEDYGVDRGKVEVTGTLNARQPSKRAGAAFDGGQIRVQGRSVKISSKLNAHGSVAAAAPEMLPPPRPDDPLLNGDGGMVMVSGRWEGSDISAASVNVAGVTAGNYRIALEDMPPGGGAFPPPPPVVIEPPPPDEEPAPLPEEPPPSVEEPPPTAEEPPPPVDEPAPAAEEPPPPVKEPAPPTKKPVVPAEKPAPVSEEPPPPVEEPAPPAEKPPPPADEQSVAPAGPTQQDKRTAENAGTVTEPVTAEREVAEAQPAAQEAPASEAVARPPAPTPVRGECGMAMPRSVDIGAGGAVASVDRASAVTLRTVCDVDLQQIVRQHRSQ
ncbi:two-partner secretion domain-containing protein [Pseudochelatococcus sp. B33]